MRHLAKPVLLIALVAGVIWALTSWPRLSEVETGKTPEYPELRVRDYGSAESVVAKAAKAAVDRLPRWTLVGSGSGPGGTEIRALASPPVLPLKSDVTIRIHRSGGKTRVSVRSKSRVGPFDFGQNARNIQAFMAELDRAMYLP